MAVNEDSKRFDPIHAALWTAAVILMTTFTAVLLTGCRIDAPRPQVAVGSTCTRPGAEAVDGDSGRDLICTQTVDGLRWRIPGGPTG